MNCQNCEKSQDFTTMNGVTYVRVGNGNVAIIGCNEHLKQLLDAYNAYDPMETK